MSQVSGFRGALGVSSQLSLGSVGTSWFCLTSWFQKEHVTEHTGKAASSPKQPSKWAITTKY